MTIVACQGVRRLDAKGQCPGQGVGGQHGPGDFLLAIDVKEIHGYREELGLVLFTEATLGRQRTGTAMGGMRLPAMPDTNGSGKANKKTKNT